MSDAGQPPAERDDWRAAHRAACSDQRRRVSAALDALIARCTLPAESLARRPGGDPRSWSGAEVLEHVVLMQRFVFVLVDKLTRRCRSRADAGEPWPTAPPALVAVSNLADAEHRWAHPEHMTPTGALAPAAAAPRLAEDRDRMLAWLDAFPEGEGTLHRIRMSAVEGDDRLDLYQWIELVLRHAERHARQIDRAAAHPLSGPAEQ